MRHTYLWLNISFFLQYKNYISKEIRKIMLCTEKPDSLISPFVKCISEGQNSLKPLSSCYAVWREGNGSTHPAGAHTQCMWCINMSCDQADCWLLLFHNAPRCCVFSLSLHLSLFLYIQSHTADWTVLDRPRSRPLFGIQSETVSDF